MLTKLLSSDKKENIDKVYDALVQLTQNEYLASSEKSAREYQTAQNVLAQNRAKSEKYLNYFMNEGGYADSGVQADARLKQELNYENNVSELAQSQAEDERKLAYDKAQQILQLERERADAHSEADTELAEQAYKDEQLDIEKQKLYLEEKKHKHDVEKAEREFSQASSGTDSGSSGSSVSGGASSSQKNTAYNAVMYNDAMKKLGECKSADDVQEIYDSLIGANTANAEALYGAYYEKLLSQARTDLLEKREAENYETKVQELCQMFLRPGARAQELFIRMYHEASMTSTSQYTPQQVEEAYRRVSRIYS